MKFDNQLRYATHVIDGFTGKQPLHVWLKDFFKVHPQMGARDRRQLRELVYCYYRMGHSLPASQVNERILGGLLLTGDEQNEFLAYFEPTWNEHIKGSLTDKFDFLSSILPSFNPAKIFPWTASLSESVDADAFSRSFFLQPDLFIRIRPGYGAKLRDALGKALVPYREISEQTLAFASSTRLEQYVALNKEAVIQDLSSQQTATFMQRPGNPSERAWDCCAASGGKSLLLHDLQPGIEITVSDIRKSILEQLAIRFREAGISGYHSFVADLSGPQALPEGSYDLILVDAPCTGSGTWSRTPESMFFYKPEKELPRYTQLQRTILEKVIPALNEKGWFVYITCSVFREENEAAVEFILANSSLRLEQKKVLTGYHQKADSMFVASFSLP